MVSQEVLNIMAGGDPSSLDHLTANETQDKDHQCSNTMADATLLDFLRKKVEREGPECLTPVLAAAPSAEHTAAAPSVPHACSARCGRPPMHLSPSPPLRW